ncbi:MAG: ABC transporter permease subunit [Pseudobdellovibrionaceae bacterium]|nr:ABC transporter permease subunit [Bdellovibrionales bacterium]USN46566.1 MAG: ABC transporter permease subunit [Pseudobdellovibrionaceae bacterium]
MSALWKRLISNRGSLLGLVILIAFVVVALAAPWLSPSTPEAVHEEALKIPPVWANGGSMAFPLGTDDLGRDLLSRLIYGARVSLGVGVLVVFLSLLLGGTLGVIAGYFGGWVDSFIMRMVDILMSIPTILLAIVVVAVLGPSLINGVIAVSIVGLPGFIRIVRAAVLAEKAKPYVDAAVGFGASHWRVAAKNIVPNCMAPIIVQATLSFSDGILNVAALGFLGLGAQPPTPEWGVMLADSRAYIESAPWLVTLPGVCILIVVLSFNILGDGLRDALDPKLRGQ